ncbi:MAG: DNA mismatch repair endonuclease MutL [Filifactoraceae bacterium]
MKNFITVLDKNTVNMISAGEVVEKPASIVKELVENSIDAEAKTIVIEIKEGGIDYIRVTDDGIGIHESQLDKVFLRHSTSKLKKIEDLSELSTNGFRGEALSAISSVSKVTLISKYIESEYAYKLNVEESSILKKELIASSQGTTIIVEDVFYNTPARKKFLKQAVKENNAIVDVVMRLAISNCNIIFKLIIDNKLIIQTLGDGDLLNTIKIVYGKNVSLNLIEINEEVGEGVIIKGYISNTSGYSSTKKNQVLEINSRVIKVSPLFSKLEYAYKNIIPIRKHPNYFLNIIINKKKIDANVHPSKMEVKIENSNIVEDMIYRAVKNNIFKSHSNMIPNIVKEFDFFKISNKNNEIDRESYSYNLLSEAKAHYETDFNSNSLGNNNIRNAVNLIVENKVNDVINDYIYDNDLSRIQNLERNNELNLELMLPIGRVFGTYIIAIQEDKMYYIDQHAAHERILFEKYMEEYKNSHIHSQVLLVPQILELSNDEYEVFIENINLINSYGYKTEGFGNKTIVIREVPSLFSKEENENFLLEILDSIMKRANIHEGEYYKEKIASLACKAAIKANYKIKEIETKELLRKLNKCNNKFTCPHGRPIFLALSKRDIEIMFKRIQ